MIRLLTINTWKCEGNYLQRLLILLKELKTLKPQIILLQEAFQSLDNRFNTSSYLAENLGFNYVSTQSRYKIRQLNGENIESYSNIAVLAQFPIVKSYTLPLPSNQQDGGRDAIAAEIKIGNKKLLVFSIHLSHIRNGDILRKMQLECILKQDFLNKSYESIFIGGDFNTEINNGFIEGFINSDIKIEDTFIYRKTESEIDYTFLNKNSVRKIDHILQLCKSNRSMLEIADSSIVMHLPDSETGLKPSDHNGVMICLKTI